MLGAPLYEAFYGLREQPFALSTDPRFLFLSSSHRLAYEELLAGLRRREGILVLTGETGSGKTTLTRAVLEALGPRTFSAIVLNPYMSGAEVVRVVLRDFNLVSRDDVRRGAFSNADMPQLLDTLEQFLRSLPPLDAQAVLVIDEAQSLSPEVLDQVRMLGSYEQDGQRLLQIVLCGQPNLIHTLEQDSMKALHDRVSRRAQIWPLPASEVESYIRHRLSIAGKPDAVRFEPDAIRLLGNLSHGSPRRLNLLCDRALEEGRAAGTSVISADLVRRLAPDASESAPDLVVVQDHAERTETPVPVEAPASGWRRPAVWLAAAGVVLAAAMGVGYWGWSIASADPGMPGPLKHPVMRVGKPANPLPVPSDDEIRSLLDGTWVGSSGQFPDNRDDFD